MRYDYDYDTDDRPLATMPAQRNGFLGPLALGFDPQDDDPRGDRDRPGTPEQQATQLARLRAAAAQDPTIYEMDPDPFTPEQEPTP